MTAAEFLPSVVNTDKLGMLAGRVGIELVETATELEILLAGAGFDRGGVWSDLAAGLTSAACCIAAIIIVHLHLHHPSLPGAIEATMFIVLVFPEPSEAVAAISIC
ncbi:hypothetical protein [Oryza sativa Japonica Group]|jgi:hypothetical protein|uniref:Uncharacterized protein n=3 Tax=Oryza TaxID=4527 RepID=A0A0P0V254_ORYSJ|nr:hypothetical protein OsJ_01665 [Oryza sativa Japonica Group]BAD52742.1 hypothetical protein [Oryza sativa Japonica Group]BAD53936.1 hypothetical protein [Oryza sativa Japonica Group]BAS72003.1 Os01g0346800 [Oryza sativa Japonica Group]